MSGPNGYGKTTLMDSIEWCLTGTIKRVYDDYMKRCSQKTERELENSSKGLIYNVNSKKIMFQLELNVYIKEIKL
ncbi:AAA family ATPase [Clostridium botulinum]|nr:AAA family ATPase [Clostridium botulinum]MCS4467585.1 AAA family ATPase [Clostridium botulinum]MCS4468691.1 AAA family ATPase [Clostridium botulinum]MCS4477516.1 AAA family ATPase [Clostridium botulinum]MCS4522778.1 AAA family ATPase [Clostridium botulinum]